MFSVFWVDARLEYVLLTVELHIEQNDVDYALAKKLWRGRFHARLERYYLREMSKVRERVTRLSLIRTLIIYNLLWFTDVSLLPDTILISAVLHFLIVSPSLIGLYYIYLRLDDAIARQWVEASAPVLISAQILLVMSLNSLPEAGYYQYFIPLVILFSNMNQRLDMRLAIAVTLVIMLSDSVVLWFQDLPLQVKLAGFTFALVASYLALLSNQRFQRDTRYGYLLRQRERFRVAAAEAEALVDPLTGLKNRRHLSKFRLALSAFPEWSTKLSVILFDIDCFKSYNDLHGHGEGDLCLKTVAKAVVQTLPKIDDVAIRYGGEEFLVLMPSTDLEGARACAEAIRACVEGLKLKHGGTPTSPYVTVSLGVASGNACAETLDLLIAAADAALYSAKAGGRNQVQCVEDPVVAPNSDQRSFIC